MGLLFLPGLPLCRRKGEKNFASGRVTRRPDLRQRFRPQPKVEAPKVEVDDEGMRYMRVKTSFIIITIIGRLIILTFPIPAVLSSGEKISVVDAVSVPVVDRQSPIRRPKPVRRLPARENSSGGNDACAGMKEKKHT